MLFKTVTSSCLGHGAVRSGDERGGVQSTPAEKTGTTLGDIGTTSMKTDLSAVAAPVQLRDGGVVAPGMEVAGQGAVAVIPCMKVSSQSCVAASVQLRGLRRSSVLASGVEVSSHSAVGHDRPSEVTQESLGLVETPSCDVGVFIRFGPFGRHRRDIPGRGHKMAV